MQQWRRQKIHIHISDGANAAHIDCSVEQVPGLSTMFVDLKEEKK
jgi:hypothetical protein